MTNSTRGAPDQDPKRRRHKNVGKSGSKQGCKSRKSLEFTPEMNAFLGELAGRLLRLEKDKAIRIKTIDPLLTTNDAAKTLDVSPRTIGRWVAEGRLRHYKFGAEGGRSTIRFSVSGIERFRKRHKEEL